MVSPAYQNIFLRLNQEANLFSYCSENGCFVYSVNPLIPRLYFSVEEFGTLSICEMVHKGNLFALVAGGLRPKFANNTVVLWDDKLKKFVLELTFSSPVLNVKLRTDKITVAEKDQIHCFSTKTDDVEKLFTVNTGNNPNGLFAISGFENTANQMLCFPGHRMGSIQILDLKNCVHRASSSPVYVNAHENQIAYIAINQQSTLIATASEKGTLIRIFDTTSARRIVQTVELRRGSDVATLYCLNFSQNAEFLCASSDKGTVHIFALKDLDLNRRSTFKKMSFLGHYIESQWALTNFTVAAECACVCGFSSDTSVFAACVDGVFTNYSFNFEGQCERLSYDVFSEMTTIVDDN